MSKNRVLVALVVWNLLVCSSAQVQTVQPAAQAPVTSSAPTGPTLADGAPVKLRIGRTVSTADAHVCDTVDLEVLDEVRLSTLLMIPRDGGAWASGAEAAARRGMH